LPPRDSGARSARGLHSPRVAVGIDRGDGSLLLQATNYEGRRLMRSGNVNFDSAANEFEVGLTTETQERDRKHYSRRRSLRTAKRRSSRAAGSNAPLGMAARRNRRWDW
jgi:hypothetical protein